MITQLLSIGRTYYATFMEFKNYILAYTLPIAAIPSLKIIFDWTTSTATAFAAALMGITSVILTVRKFRSTASPIVSSIVDYFVKNSSQLAGVKNAVKLQEELFWVNQNINPHLPLFLATADNGNWVKVNQSMLDLVSTDKDNVTDSDLLGQSWLSYVSPDQVDTVNENYNRAISNNASFQWSITLNKKAVQLHLHPVVKIGTNKSKYYIGYFILQ